jgi:PEGA domain
MNHAQVLAFAGIAFMLCGCSGWSRGIGFGLFDSAPAIPPTASIELDSDPQGAEAKTSLGTTCKTPCALEVPTSGGFSVTFAREGFTPQTVPVQVQPGQEAPSIKFTPNPVFAQLAAAPGAKKKPVAKKPAPQPAAAAPSMSGR